MTTTVLGDAVDAATVVAADVAGTDGGVPLLPESPSARAATATVSGGQDGRDGGGGGDGKATFHDR